MSPPTHRKRRRWLIGSLAALAVVGLILGACHSFQLRMPGPRFRGALPPLDAPTSALRDRRRRHVEELAGTIGERHLGRPQALEASREVLARELRAAGYAVERQAYVVDGREVQNLEVGRTGATTPREIVVIGAHYDSARGTPGADDNASGVAALLELARAFADRTPGRTLRFVAFVNEEPPYFRTSQMGSYQYAQRCRERQEQVVAMLSLETMGLFSDRPQSQHYPFPMSLFYPSRGDFIGFIGSAAAVDLVRTVVASFRRHEPFPAEGSAITTLIRGVDWSDHWGFGEMGYPALMVTDTALFRNRHYHRATDRPDTLDYDRLARVTRGLGAVARELSRTPP